MLILTAVTERLARLVAVKTGKTPEAVVHEAVEKRARAEGVDAAPRPARDLSPEAISGRKARMRRIAGEIAAMPVLDQRSPAKIMEELNDP